MQKFVCSRTVPIKIAPDEGYFFIIVNEAKTSLRLLSQFDRKYAALSG